MRTENILARAFNDPAVRAENEQFERRARERALQWLVRLEGHYRAMPEAESNWEAAIGRDLILKMIPLVRQSVQSDRTSGWTWRKEIRDIEKLHSRVSLELGRDTCRGLKVREGARQGHKARYGSIREKREKYQPIVDKIARSNPSLSRKRINALAGKEIGVSYKAVERHTTGPRGKKKKLDSPATVPRSKS